MKRYYVDWYYPNYNIRKIKQGVKAFTGFNVRTSNKFGWSNQPSVVTFSFKSWGTTGHKYTIDDLETRLSSFLKRNIIIFEKDW